MRFAELSAQEAERLDQLCDTFEQQLLSSQNPKIETFLVGCHSDSANALLRELLSLEIEFLRDDTPPPDIETYRIRFPQSSAILNEVFQQSIDADVTIHPSGQSSQASASGSIVIPNYTILSRLGEGGMGTVYRATQTVLKNEAAIKVLKAGMENNSELQDLFDQETRNLGQLRHPHIVQALYAGTTNQKRPYLVMEMIRGLDVSVAVRRCGPLTVADACEIVRQASLGLQHAHECKMVHRDIKPSNLLLGWTPGNQATIKVADFGFARIRQRDAWFGCDQDDHRVMGTLDYMSPEQYFTPADVDIRTDVFSLGCTLYALLVGRPPFAGQYESMDAKMQCHRDQPAPSLQTLRPDVPEALEEVISYAMAKDRSDRFEDPEGLADSLTHFNAGHDLPLLLEYAEERTEVPNKPLMVGSTISLKR